VWTRPVAGAPYPLGLAEAPGEPVALTGRLSGLVLVLAVLVGYFTVVTTVPSAVMYLGYLVDAPAGGWTAYATMAQGFGNVWGVAGAHLGLGAMTLVVWALYRFHHHRRLAWLWSVWPGVRWRYAVLCLAVALVVVGAVSVYHWLAGPGLHPLPGWGWYAAVIVATTPLQALAEEVMFRGYLMQAFGVVWSQPWFPIVATAVVFALFHGTQNPWLFGSRLVFGLVAGVLVWRTGGLEAPVAIHIVNNLCAFGLAVASGTLVQVRGATAVGWAQASLDVAMFAACALACWGLARALRVSTRAG
jgi:membrane protease YdiL (CAAX protease family)